MIDKTRMRMLLSTAVLIPAIQLSACASEKKEVRENESAQQPGTAAPGGVAAGGDTTIVEAWSDANGNYFKPSKIEAHPGDVIRYVLKSGVHNVNFLPDSNAVKTGLPPASEMLQLPDQTYDVVVSMAPGKYYFQCDPHAALGMKGQLEVEDKHE